MEAISHTLALLLIVIRITTISPSSATTASTTATTTSFDAATSFIIFTCKSTTYPKLCENTCLPFAPNITVDLKRMAHYAINSTLAVSKDTSWKVHQVSKEKKLKQPEKAAIDDCIKLTMDSVAQIKKSLDGLDQMKNGTSDKDREFKLLSVKTWMSAAMANYQTCMDGLEEVNASAALKREVSSRIRYATMLSSNALAIVNKIK